VCWKPRVTVRCGALSPADRYPFPFTVTATLSVKDGAVKLTMRVANTASEEGSRLPFSIGNHISLQFPFLPSAGSWEDGVVRSSGTVEHKLSGRSLLTGQMEARPELGEGGLPITSKTPDACNMVLGGFGAADAFVEVVQPGAMSVRVTQSFGDGPEGLSSRLADHRHFVFWGDADAGFFCPEPWVSGPSALNTRAGLIVLEPGQSQEWGFEVNVASL
jgi:galactose mutarotase-like enzyme